MSKSPRLRSQVNHPGRPSGEAGLTLIELLVAITIMVIVTGAAMAMLISAFKKEPEVRARANQIGDARVAMEKMVRELRQGGSVTEGGDAVVRFETSATCDGAAPCTVVIDCATAERCARSEEGVAGSTTILSGVSNDEVFSYTPAEDPSFVGIRIELPTADGRGTTALEDGATLRGFGLGDEEE